MKHPLLIIGLDGATFDVLDPLFADGQLPTLRRLASEGARTELFSTVPPVTLPAWTSFMTGCNPGKHGITDLLVHRSDYGLHPAQGSLRTEPTFMARLSEQGLNVAAISVPGTYPPEPINGICIAGFDAPGVRAAKRDAMWPPELYDEVQRLGGWSYATFNEHRAGRDKLRSAVDELERDIAQKEKVILHLHGRRPWDVFFVHLQASDTVGHHLWHTFDPSSPRAVANEPLSDSIPRIYGRLDTLVSRLLSRCSPETRVLVVSDHGMGGASRRTVYLNRWLHHMGLLEFRASSQRHARNAAGRALRGILSKLPRGAAGAALRVLPENAAARLVSLARSTQVAYSASQAFSDELDYAPAIWLNRVGSFPEGCVRADDATALLDRISDGLLEITCPDSGQPLVKAVHRRQDVMRGPHIERAPDLIIEPAWPNGYRSSFLPSPGPGPTLGELSQDVAYGGKGAGMPGVHRREGVFIAWGPGITATELPVLEIAQAGALVYCLSGQERPAEIEAQLPAYLDGLLPLTPRASTTSPQPRQHAPPPSGPNSHVVLERLRGMGYIE